MMIEIETLLEYGSVTKPISAEEIIFREEHPGYYYYQLISGGLRAVNINDSGKEFLQQVIEPGESFGELPLLDGGNYAITVIANENSEIIKLPRENFNRLLQDYPALNKSFLDLICQRLRFKYFVVKQSGYHNPEISISNLLKYFKENGKNICSKCNKINLTRQQIADMLGIRVETVIRSVRHLHDKGILEIRKGKVYCND